MTKLRVLVLGGSGRIGSLVRRSWARETGTAFTFQTRHPSPTHQGDIVWNVLSEPPDTLGTVPPFDCMVVLSGIVPGPGADLSLNTAIGSACIAAAAQYGIGHVLLASSSAVYGSYSDDPFSERDPPEPVNHYGRAKHAMEVACHTQARASGVHLCCLRIGNVAGADALLLNGAALDRGKTLQLDCFSDGGTPRRSYIGPDSLARAIVSLVRHRAQLPDVLNIAAPSPVTMGALAKAAGMPVTLHTAQDTAHQHITLDCNALAVLHEFDPAESTAAEMISQWRSALDEDTSHTA